MNKEVFSDSKGKKILCIDLGNTRFKMACFAEEGTILEVLYFRKEQLEDITERLFKEYVIEVCVLSSVVAHSKRWEANLRRRTHLIKVGEGALPPPLSLPQPYVGKMGADRIALAVGALQRKKGINQLIISLGTCITYNFINVENVFIGGSISAGMMMRFQAMHQLTAQLPIYTYEQITELPQFPLIGYDTKSHLISGVCLGMYKEMEGIIKMYDEKFSGLHCLITGGDASFIAKEHQKMPLSYKVPIVIDEFLLFKGLYALGKI